MMLFMLDILISALNFFYPVRITPHYVIAYLVILIRVGLMGQGVVRQVTGMFMVFLFSQLLGVGKDFSPSGCSVLFSVVSLVLSVIGGISDPTVPVPFVSEIFWATLNFDIYNSNHRLYLLFMTGNLVVVLARGELMIFSDGGVPL